MLHAIYLSSVATNHEGDEYTQDSLVSLSTNGAAANRVVEELSRRGFTAWTEQVTFPDGLVSTLRDRTVYLNNDAITHAAGLRRSETEALAESLGDPTVATAYEEEDDSEEPDYNDDDEEPDYSDDDDEPMP
jgi:hypothetical protein